MAASAGDHSVTLTWTDPSDSNITRYEYQVNHTDTGTGNLSGWSSWKNIPGSDSSTTTYAFTGLTNGKEYRYKIRAVVEIGEGNDAPGKPAPGANPWYVSASPNGPTPPPAVSKFWVERVCDHHFRVRWHRVSGATGYDLNLSRTHRKSWERKMTNKNYNAWQFSQWDKDGTYWLAIRAVNAHGASEWTDVRSVAPPCPVEGLKATYAANGDVSVKWNPAKRASGYDVNFSSDAGKSWQRMVSNHSATTYSFNRDPQTLPWNPNFLVAVQSRKGGMTGGWRNAPISPLTVSNVGGTTATLNLPGYSGNWWYQADTGPDSSSCQGPVSAPTKALTSLTHTTTYTYKAYDQANCNSADEIATVTFTTAAPTPGSRDSSKDFSLDSNNDYPYGIWSNGVTMWVAQDYDDNLYAYQMSDQSRDSSKDFSLDGSNDEPYGIWSNRVTMWVLDYYDAKLYAYRMSDQSRDSSKDIGLAFYEPSGIWSNGVTMWVADIGEVALHAYSLTGKTRDSGKDIILHGHNSEPGGIWSDGATMWVVDTNDTKVYAYKMSDGSRDSAKEYTTLSAAGNNDPFGIWSDGVTTWVVDASDEKLYAYHSKDPGAKLTAPSVGATTATLYLGGHTGAWWYQQTSGSGGTCRSVAAGTSTASLTALAHGTTYTYKAYDQANCNSADEIATVTFTTAGVSVSNLGETNSATESVGGWNYTSPFTTGSASAGYTLDSVAIPFAAKTGSPAAISVKIYSDSNGRPGAEVANATFTGPNNPSNQDAEYVCSGSGCALSASTTYHLHLSRAGNTGAYLWRSTASDNEANAPSTAGWSIGNGGHRRITSSDPWDTMQAGRVGKFKVMATVTP